MNYIDLRSDTVTQPTPAMRQAMMNAPVGDDVYGDDPSMNELESYAARLLGKEAGLFVTSGTMGNQLSIMTHTNRGEEIIVGAESHIYEHEVGAAAVLSNVTLCMLPFAHGMPDPAMIEGAIRPKGDIHVPRTALICLENALAGGRVVPLETMKAIREVSLRHGIPIHLDGARLFNAAAVLGVPASELAACCDSVSFCLSKGLCAPVGSVIVGSREFIDRARKYRKLLGGGMRQAGFLAAAGLVALREMVARLPEDHENARYLADLLEKIPGITVDRDALQINMVWCDIDIPEEALNALPEKMLKFGIKIGEPLSGKMRFVTNHDVTRADLDLMAAALEKCLK